MVIGSCALNAQITSIDVLLTVVALNKQTVLAIKPWLDDFRPEAAPSACLLKTENDVVKNNRQALTFLYCVLLCVCKIFLAVPTAYVLRSRFHPSRAEFSRSFQSARGLRRKRKSAAKYVR